MAASLRAEAHAEYDRVDPTMGIVEFLIAPISHKIAWVAKISDGGMSVDEVCDSFEQDNGKAIESMNVMAKIFNDSLSTLTPEEREEVMSDQMGLMKGIQEALLESEE